MIGARRQADRRATGKVGDFGIAARILLSNQGIARERGSGRSEG
jgi:hypothetical protein